MVKKSINIDNIRKETSSTSTRIYLRQREGSEISWITFTQGNPTKVNFFPNKDVTEGDYELILESYDADSVHNSTLQTDTVMIRVEAPDMAYNPKELCQNVKFKFE